MKAVVFSFTQKGTFLAQEVADWLRNEAGTFVRRR